MKFGKRLASFLLAGLMVLTMGACSGGEEKKPEESKEESKVESQAEGKQEPAAPAEIKKVGIAMPTKDLQRWSQDGENLKTKLEEKGIETELQFANNDIGTQVSQLENMITNGCNLLIVASIDGSALTNVLDTAKASGVTVIAYDRLIMNSDAVSYYATFDNNKVGKMQGQYIADALDLEHKDGPFNLEIVTGPTDDNNVVFFYGGAMEVLQPYIDAGKLVVPSGQISRQECATPEWSNQKAQERMENILSSFYNDGKNLDVVLCSNDATAHGVASALAENYNGASWPVITGQDCEITNVKSIIEGKQAMSVFKDTRALASAVVDMVMALSEGKEVPVNDTKTYDNGTGIIPSFLVEPVAATKENYKELLVDSGYYTEDDLK
uniref:multiple monosaccharide ABC transporter substrate-binding protein n=1 Tax=Ndongobacter massiliensis TaxID=1871025 RepID=UPI000931671F|nr:multiple monosaccharide ABC transporter substrate-binding protein [Ndongobacter massiliensis]